MEMPTLDTFHINPAANYRVAARLGFYEAVLISLALGSGIWNSACSLEEAGHELCKAEGIDDEVSHQTLLQYLHDLGIVLNFREDPRLVDTNILNPEWVTKGVYQILNMNELFQNKGVLDLEMLDRALDTDKYPKDKHMFIVDMMRKFELCFDFEGFRDKKVLVPDLLSKEEPYTGEWGNSLGFQYHYTILPGSIMSRFIVRMHEFVYKNTYWRTGVVLAHRHCKALVKADSEEKIIYIEIVGPKRNRRELLAVIRSNFDTIHRTIPKIQAQERIPLADNPEVVIGYEHLLRLEEMREQSYVPEGGTRKIRIKATLDRIESEDERRERRMERWQEMSTGWSKTLAFAFGLSFIVVMLLVAIFLPHPTIFQLFVFRVVLSLAAAEVGAVVPGFLNLDVTREKLLYIRAGGAMALFLVIYLINPPALLSASG